MLKYNKKYSNVRSRINRDNSINKMIEKATSIDNIVCMLEIKGELKKSQRQNYRDVASYLVGSEDAPSSEAELRKQKIQQHVDDLIENSSLHGLSYIFDKRHSIRRMLWFIITVAAFGYSMQKVYESTVNYLDYPFNTARMRQYVNEINFPAVSFCNLNDMRMSKLNGTSVDEAILDSAKSGNVTDAAYRNTTRGAAHLLEEMLVECKFNGKACSAKNFTSFNWMQGDRCYTFNSGKRGHKVLSVTGTGVERSLSLTINVQHYDYYRGGTEAGIHLILHGQDETPIKMRGPQLSPGYTNYIQVEKKQIINLKSPYKTKCGSLKLEYFKEYSMHTCWLEQLTNHVTKICKCKDFFMPGNFSICSLTANRNCTWPEWENFEKNKLYKCPLPCEIHTYYGHSNSRALFPSQMHAETMANQIKNQTHMKGVFDDVKDELQFFSVKVYRIWSRNSVFGLCIAIYGNKLSEYREIRDYIWDNFLKVVIFYDDLSYETLEQQPSYGTLVWLGDIGGQIGLFVGAGAMSYFEFIDCLFLIIYAKFFQSFKPNPASV